MFSWQDLDTALLGSFSDGRMLSGRPVEVVAQRCRDGIKELRFSDPRPEDGGPEFSYRPPDRGSFGDQPLETDPLDTKYMYLASSVGRGEMMMMIMIIMIMMTMILGRERRGRMGGPRHPAADHHQPLQWPDHAGEGEGGIQGRHGSATAGETRSDSGDGLQTGGEDDYNDVKGSST